MIGRVYTGYDPGGLLRYLFGPGRHNDHDDPRVVATWDGRAQRWQPEHVGPGAFDVDLAAITDALNVPAQAAGLPLSTPDPRRREHRRYFRTGPDGYPVLRAGYVWHCTLRNHAQDRVLSDADWAHIAEEIMHGSGVAPRGDSGGPRWVAVRHDDEGIHLVAVLVRQDTARRVHPAYDKRRLREAARFMERVYGLTATAPADGTAAPAPARAEREKSARTGRAPARAELRTAVAEAAAASLTVAGFEHALTEAGYLVRLRRLSSGDVAGYTVARPGDVTRTGEPVWYSGSRLAPDLSLPKLARRWAQARRGRTPATGLDDPGLTGQVWVTHGEELVERARQTLLAEPSQVHGIAHAVGEVWTVLDHSHGRLLTGPGARWDRAARHPHTPVPETGRVADELRWLARGLVASQVPSHAALALAASLAALALQIATLLQDSGRALQQVRAARQTSHLAGQHAAQVSGSQPPPTTPATSRRVRRTPSPPTQDTDRPRTRGR